MHKRQERRVYHYPRHRQRLSVPIPRSHLYRQGRNRKAYKPARRGGGIDKMKFAHVLATRTTLKKKGYFEFPELSDEDMIIGKTHTFDNPYMIHRNGRYFALYGNVLVFLHSFDKFMEKK